MSHEDACLNAEKFLDSEPNLRENFLQNVRNDALSSPEMRNLYYSRAHEKSNLIGGIIRVEDENGNVTYKLVQDDIKQCNVSMNQGRSRGDKEIANIAKV